MVQGAGQRPPFPDFLSARAETRHRKAGRQLAEGQYRRAVSRPRSPRAKIQAFDARLARRTGRVMNTRGLENTNPVDVARRTVKLLMVVGSTRQRWIAGRRR